MPSAVGVLPPYTRVSAGHLVRPGGPLAAAQPRSSPPGTVRSAPSEPPELRDELPGPRHGDGAGLECRGPGWGGGMGPPQCSLLRGARPSAPRDFLLHDRALPFGRHTPEPAPCPSSSPRQELGPQARRPDRSVVGSRRAAASRLGSPGAGGEDSEKQVLPQAHEGERRVVTQAFRNWRGAQGTGRRWAGRSAPGGLSQARCAEAQRCGHRLMEPPGTRGLGCSHGGPRLNSGSWSRPDLLDQRIVFLRSLLHNRGSLTDSCLQGCSVLCTRKGDFTRAERSVAGIKASGQG